jgi:hypothetical protein
MSVFLYVRQTLGTTDVGIFVCNNAVLRCITLYYILKEKESRQRKRKE